MNGPLSYDHASCPRGTAMSDDQSGFAPLLREVQEGRAGAVEELISRYGKPMLRIVRRWFKRKLRSEFDSQDMLQAAWASFFTNVEELQDCREIRDLAAYLGALAQNKTVDEMRRGLRRRRQARHGAVPWDK